MVSSWLVSPVASIIFVWVVLAVPLYLGEHLNVRKLYLIEDNGVVSRVVELGHSLGGIIGHTHREKSI